MKPATLNPKPETRNSKVTPIRTHPEGLLPSLRTMRFVCPRCRGPLAVASDAYRCSACAKRYALHAGIPDFRVFDDPYLTYEEDRERTEIVLAGLEKYELEKLLEYYWTFSDITPENLRPVYVRSAMLGEQRARRAFDILEDGTFRRPVKAKRILEIGCGTGNFLAVGAERGGETVGVDIAMRWLHLSRRRFIDKGLEVPPLVCACAEYLPFADDSFDLVAMSSTLEFTSDPARVFGESARVLSARGALFVNTVNRFSLAPDPYAQAFGVGWLPRRLQARYVKWRRGATYKTRTLSFGELARLGRCDFAAAEFALPDVGDEALARLPRATQRQIKLYRFFKKLPVFSFLLKRLGPGWDIVWRKEQF